MELFISSLIFLFIFVVLIIILLRPWTEATHQRVDDYLLASRQAPDNAMPTFTDRILLPALRSLGQAVMGLTPASTLQKIRTKLDAAGNPRHFGVVEYIGTKVLSIAVIIPVGVLALRLLPLPRVMEWLMLMLVVGIGIWLPDIILQRIIETRQVTIRRALPDVIDLLAISVEAGIGFDGAVQKVVERARSPLELELGRVLEQVRLGKSRGEALEEMGRRSNVPELITFTAAVTQAEVLGISIAKVLRSQANTARERRTQRARELAAQLPVKLLFPLVMFIFPSLFVVILGPGLIRIYEIFK